MPTMDPGHTYSEPMMQARPRVLITGFGPFPGVADNVSARLAYQLATRAGSLYPRHRFVAAVLPVSWSEAPRLLNRLVGTHQPVLALHFGVSARAESLIIETTARNEACSEPDCEQGLAPARRLKSQESDHHRVTIPAERAALHLARAGVPVALSDDAGAYLCNAILYHSLTISNARAVRSGGARHRAGFIHVPAALVPGYNVPIRGASLFPRTETRPKAPSEPRPLTWEMALAGSLEILRLSLMDIRRR